MEDHIKSTKAIRKNCHNGTYSNGTAYLISKTSDMLNIYFDVANKTVGEKPSLLAVALPARVSFCFVYKVLKEYLASGYLQEPDLVAAHCYCTPKISPEAALYLLVLRTKVNQ